MKTVQSRVAAEQCVAADDARLGWSVAAERSVLRTKKKESREGKLNLPELADFVGLWASPSGPVLWIRPGRGNSVRVSLAPGPREPAISHGARRASGGQVTLVGTWDRYLQSVRVRLPQFPNETELQLEHDNYSWVDEGTEPWDQLVVGVSTSDVPAALRATYPPWVLPRKPYRRVPEAEWSEFAIAASVGFDRRSQAPGGRNRGGPQNNEMHLTRSATAGRRGPRR